MKRQMSESVILYLLLALSGGCMDAYSFLFRDHVFANAQTGNILLFGINLASKEYTAAIRYFWPILAFTLGIVVSDLIHAKITYSIFHWRQVCLVIQILLFVGVCFMPQAQNHIANALISFACGLQVETFRKLKGNVITTTMCIGNLRSGTNNLITFFKTRNKKYFYKSIIYYGVIISFVIGAIIESRLIEKFDEKALIFSVVLLVASFLIMLINEEGEKS